MVSNQWTETNTPMTQKRRGHECVKINQDKIFVIGGEDENYDYLKLTEIYHRRNNSWTTGPILPKTLSYGKLIKASPGAKFFGYYLGGYGNGGWSSAIYGLSKDLSNFQLIGNLKKARSGHVAFRLPKSISDKCSD